MYKKHLKECQPLNNNPKLRFKDKNGNAYPEWSQEKIGNLTKIYDGTHQTPKYTDKGIKFLSVENISDIQASNKFISEEAYNSEFKVKPEVNDILMTRIGDIGTPALVNTNEQYAYYVSLALIKCSRELFPNWLVQAILSNGFQKQLYKRTLHVAFPKKINKGEIGECIVNYPCIEEQEKIAGFLSKVDELINECEGEVKDLEEQKKGLMQKIFSQQIRFKDSNNNPYPDWEEKVMNDILNEYCKKNSISNQYPVLTSSKQGLMLQTEYYSGENRITEKDNIGFNIIPPNYITYRSRSDDGLFTFNINNLGVTGIVSTYYPVFSTNYNNLFVITYLNINKNNLFKYAVGSSQKVLSLNELKKVKIKLPCQEEQEKITKVLSKMDELIEEKKELLSDWQQFKKGLLQQMFV